MILEFLQLIETANSADRYAAKQINAFSFSFSFAAYPDEYVCVLCKKLPFSQQMIIRFFSGLGCVKTWFDPGENSFQKQVACLNTLPRIHAKLVCAVHCYTNYFLLESYRSVFQLSEMWRCKCWGKEVGPILVGGWVGLGTVHDLIGLVRTALSLH